MSLTSKLSFRARMMLGSGIPAPSFLLFSASSLESLKSLYLFKVVSAETMAFSRRFDLS